MTKQKINYRRAVVAGALAIALLIATAAPGMAFLGGGSSSPERGVSLFGSVWSFVAGLLNPPTVEELGASHDPDG